MINLEKITKEEALKIATYIIKEKEELYKDIKERRLSSSQAKRRAKRILDVGPENFQIEPPNFYFNYIEKARALLNNLKKDNELETLYICFFSSYTYIKNIAKYGI